MTGGWYRIFSKSCRCLRLRSVPDTACSVRGKPKASCNAFKLLTKMNGRLMPVEFAGTQPDCAGIIACCDSSCIRLLIWNHCPNEVYERKTWQDTIKAQIPATIAGSADFQGISAKISEHHGSAYETWRQMGSPLNLTSPQEELLDYAIQWATNQSISIIIESIIQPHFNLS